MDFLDFCNPPQKFRGNVVIIVTTDTHEKLTITPFCEMELVVDQEKDTERRLSLRSIDIIDLNDSTDDNEHIQANLSMLEMIPFGDIFLIVYSEKDQGSVKRVGELKKIITDKKRNQDVPIFTFGSSSDMKSHDGSRENILEQLSVDIHIDWEEILVDVSEGDRGMAIANFEQHARSYKVPFCFVGITHFTAVKLSPLKRLRNAFRKRLFCGLQNNSHETYAKYIIIHSIGGAYAIEQL